MIMRNTSKIISTEKKAEVKKSFINLLSTTIYCLLLFYYLLSISL